jgi:hypothetical protein
MLSYQTFQKGEIILTAGKVTECLYILFDGDAVREPDQYKGGSRVRLPPKVRFPPHCDRAVLSVRVRSQAHLGSEGLRGEPAKHTITAMGNMRSGQLQASGRER